MTTELIQDEREQAAMVQSVTFHVASEEYAVDILHVQEILRPREMTRVPKAPSFLTGVINLRGQIVPVINLRTRLGMAPSEQTQDSRIVVVNHSGKTVGLIVDAMSEVLRISESVIHPPPVTPNAQFSSEYIQGVAKLEKRLLIFLDLAALLGEEID